MINTGLFGIGLAPYWPQFDGLLKNLQRYQQQIKTRIESFGVEVVDAGMVDNPDHSVRDAAFSMHINNGKVLLFASYKKMGFYPV